MEEEKSNIIPWWKVPVDAYRYFKANNLRNSSDWDVYWGLLIHVNYVNNICFPSEATLAHETGLSIKTIQRALKRLESKMIIAIGKKPCEKGGMSNLYAVRTPEKLSELYHSDNLTHSTEKDVCDNLTHSPKKP